MALFTAKEGAETRPLVGPGAPSQINLIGEGTVLEGALEAEHDVRVSGRIVGKLSVQGKAIIAPEGSLKGELYAESADVAGTIEGDVEAAGRVILRGTARVEGNVVTERLVIEEGAVFNGQSMMRPGTPGAQKAPGVRAQPAPEPAQPAPEPALP